MEEQIKSNRSERGQSMVELAFTLVLLLILLAGVVDLGRAFFVYMALRDAAQEGAVYGSICPKNETKIIARVRQNSSAPVNLADTTNVIVECAYVNGASTSACDGNAVPGRGIRVRVTYNDFRITMPFVGALLGRQTVPMSAQVTDTILRNNTCP